MSLASKGGHMLPTGGNQLSVGGLEICVPEGHRWMASSGTCAYGVECPFES